MKITKLQLKELIREEIIRENRKEELTKKFRMYAKSVLGHANKIGEIK